MQIEIYTLEKPDIWDEIVESFKNYDVYYLSGYVKAFELNGDGKAQLIYIHNEKNKAINVVMCSELSTLKFIEEDLRDSVLGMVDLTSPYGYGGFLFEGEDPDEVAKSYIEFCISRNVISEFVRFHPLLQNNNAISKLIYKDIYLGETVCIDTTDKKTIWENCTSKKRNMIRKAQKAGVNVYWGREPSILTPFIELYEATMDKDNASSYYYFPKEFYESILYDLKDNALWFYAVKDDRIIAISIIMFANGTMHYHLSASDKEFNCYSPTDLLIYEAAVWGSKNGFSKFHIGGGLGSRHDGLYSFKKGFNRRTDLEFHIGQRIYRQDIYDKMVEAREDLNNRGILTFDKNTEFFPKYRGGL